MLVNIHHLSEARPFTLDDVVGERDGERLLADGGLRGQDGVAQAARLRLADINYFAQTRNRVQLAAKVVLPPPRKLVLELEGDVKMVLDGGLPAAGHKHHHGDARASHFLDGILNQGLVNDRQHFLGLRLGGGQESRA